MFASTPKHHFPFKNIFCGARRVIRCETLATNSFAVYSSKPKSLYPYFFSFSGSSLSRSVRKP